MVAVAPEVRGPVGLDVELLATVDDGERREVIEGTRSGDDRRPAGAVIGFSGVLAGLPWVFDLGVPVVVDAYDPGLLETLQRFRGSPFNEQRTWVADATRHLCDPLDRADLVLVANERQRHLVLGLLAAAGRVNARTWAEDPTMGELCAVVPFGTATPRPEPVADGPLRRGGPLVPAGGVVALWGGGLYDWLDPLLLVEAVDRCPDERVQAVFLAGPHPTPAVGRLPLVERVRARARELGLLGNRIRLVEEWVPYHERGAWLCGSDIGVSLHLDHLETTFANRTRILDYLWAGLPVLCSAGDHFADVVAAHDLGVVVPVGDAGAVAEGLARLAGTADGERGARRQRLADMAAATTWARVTAPLVEWCAAPRLAADRRTAASG